MGARPHLVGGLVISSFSSLQLRVDDFKIRSLAVIQLFFHDKEDMEKLRQVQDIPASKLKVKLNLRSGGGDQGGLQRLTAVFA